MRSLVIAPTLPNDAANGLAMRIGMFVEALRGLGEVTLMVLPVFGEEARTNAFCRRLGIAPVLVPVDGRVETPFAIVNGIRDPAAQLEAFRRYGKPTQAAFLSVPVLNDIRAHVGASRFDVVHVARSYLLPVIGLWPEKERPPVSVDLDEDDAGTHRRIAKLHASRGALARAARLEAEADALEALAAEWLPKADMAFIATSREAALIGARHEVHPIVVPNAVALPPLTSRAPGAGTFLFVGGFGYFPNLDAALWIVEAIVPALRQRLGAAASVTLVGRNAPERLTTRAARAGVRILGAAEDLAPLYAEACAALVPLRAGGGSRIKLLEAAAHGVPVVATTLGAEDSGLEDGRHIWIADTPEAIADACAAIRRNPETAAQRAASAYAFVAEARERTAAISTLRAHFATSIATAHENTGGGRF